jgi:hypothetical protein
MVDRELPMMIAPPRSAALLGATLKLIVPPPEPLSGAAKEIQFTSVDAVHPHSLAAAIVTPPLPPLAGMLCEAGLRSKRHGARCDTRTVLSLTVMTPSRVADPSLGAARKDTVPLPWLDVGESPEIQLAVVDAVHAHSG